MRRSEESGSETRPYNAIHFESRQWRPSCGGQVLRMNRFIFPALGCTLQAFTPNVMASRAKRNDEHTIEANPRATFKLFGQAPMQATILSRNRAGFWIQGGKLAELLGSCDYSGADVDVCFLSANKVEWYKVASGGANASETGQ
jgi:hypothetical protein